MNETSFECTLPDEAATQQLAEQLATCVEGGLVIWLEGSLGAGKTVFARRFLQALGVGERVKSPTYSLIEPYVLADKRSAWHLDLYRIADASELEWLGLDELGSADAVILIEWPERGAGALPAADLHVQLTHAGHSRETHLKAASRRGEVLLDCLKSSLNQASGDSWSSV